MGGNSHSLLVEMKNGTAALKESLQFLTKFNLALSCNPVIAITLLAIGSTNLKTHVHTKTFMEMFIIALFIIFRHWKQ